MEKIKVLIVDDEPLARRNVARMLQNDPDVEIVGVCANGQQALSVTLDSRPDLIFLDIQMPRMDGFAFLEALGAKHTPLVIFITAYDHYALEAFDVYALDYLLKPVDPERFEKALNRAKERLRKYRGNTSEERILAFLEEIRKKDTDVASAAGAHTSTPTDYLLVKTGERRLFLHASEVDWIGAEGKYVRLHVGKNSYLLREAIGNIESRLDSHKFIRIHRSAIVNIERVKEMYPLFHGEYEIVLHDGTKLTLSRRFRAKLQQIIGSQL